MRYVVTKHCINQFKSRYRYRFHESYFLNDELVKNLIIYLLEHSSEDHLIKYSPFYKNKFAAVYSHNTTIYRSNRKDIVFAVKFEKETIVCLTVFKHFDVRTFVKI